MNDLQCVGVQGAAQPECLFDRVEIEEEEIYPLPAGAAELENDIPAVQPYQQMV